MNKSWIYDIEIYPNLFLLVAFNIDTKEYRQFQVSPIGDDRRLLIEWLDHEVLNMIGFNNVRYDYKVIHKALTKFIHLPGKEFTYNLYQISKQIVEQDITFYIKNQNILVKQTDLFLINHYNNKARMTSLKLLEFNMRVTNIIELPYNPHSILKKSEIEHIIKYCYNDVNATYELYLRTISEIELREKLSKQHGKDYTNYDSTKIGETILIDRIIEKMGEDVVYDYIETDYGGQKRVIINTPRDKIELNDIIFDYVSFTTEPFQKLLKWLKNRTIIETKGAFTDIPFEDMRELDSHYEIVKKKGNQKMLNILYKGFRFDFGVGGIHGSVEPSVWEENDEYCIIDIDVKSYYPNLAIKNRYFPEHLSELFCDIYEEIYVERGTYPKKTHPSENLMLKLALNGAYGKSNSKWSPLYDPKYTMTTTINGELLLSMLSERVLEEMSNIHILQINTDGVVFRLKRKDVHLLENIVKRWERLTKLSMEYTHYSKLVIKDVNNYIAVKTDGKVKRKGSAFIYKIAPGELELHKNFSMLIIPKALEAYFVYGKPVDEFIYNHDDLYDFFKRTKINRKDTLFGDTLDEYGNIVTRKTLQRITRYFISGSRKVINLNGRSKITNKEELISNYGKIKLNQFEGDGLVLTKEMQPLPGNTKKRYSNVEVKSLCTIVNNLDDLPPDRMRGMIYYPYYIEEVNKIIKTIENEQ